MPTNITAVCVIHSKFISCKAVRLGKAGVAEAPVFFCGRGLEAIKRVML